MAEDKVERLEAEVKAGKTFVIVPLCGKPVRVKPTREWKSRALSLLRSEDIEAWASLSLVEDDYATVWQKVDPTIGDCDDFLKAWQRVSGQNAGE